MNSALPVTELDLSRTVQGDDPFTSVVEPSVPATLGILVYNQASSHLAFPSIDRACRASAAQRVNAASVC